MFTKLVEIITLPENIKLAYRNIKKNKGSKTAGTDGKTIQHLEKLSEEKLVVLVQRKFKMCIRDSPYPEPCLRCKDKLKKKIAHLQIRFRISIL